MKKLIIGVKAFKCTMCGDAVYGRAKYSNDEISCYCGNLTAHSGCCFSHHGKILGSDRFDFEVKFPQTARICNVYLKIKPMPYSKIEKMFYDDYKTKRNKYGRWIDSEFDQQLRITSKAKMDLIREPKTDN